jgi:hypothetical protein
MIMQTERYELTSPDLVPSAADQAPAQLAARRFETTCLFRQPKRRASGGGDAASHRPAPGPSRLAHADRSGPSCKRNRIHDATRAST